MIINKMIALRIDWRIPKSSVEYLKEYNLEDENEHKLPEYRTEDRPTHQLSWRHLFSQFVMRFGCSDEDGCGNDQNDVLVKELRV